mmetsp:Transcript_5506/g.17759  ORF Transcript_5506/g.17759 Transcript_5506/m.17759 type:complete len:207 (+) Transcript_5506:394-1014(+)
MTAGSGGRGVIPQSTTSATRAASKLSSRAPTFRADRRPSSTTARGRRGTPPCRASSSSRARARRASQASRSPRAESTMRLMSAATTAALPGTVTKLSALWDRGRTNFLQARKAGANRLQCGGSSRKSKSRPSAWSSRWSSKLRCRAPSLKLSASPTSGSTSFAKAPAARRGLRTCASRRAPEPRTAPRRSASGGATPPLRRAPCLP